VVADLDAFRREAVELGVPVIGFYQPHGCRHEEPPTPPACDGDSRSRMVRELPDLVERQLG